MTIKQENKPTKFNIDWGTIWFGFAVTTPLVLFIAMFIVPLEDKIFFKQWAFVGGIILASTIFINGKNYENYINDYKKLMTLVSLAVLITMSIMASGYKTDAMVLIIKENKPKLITDFSSCSKKKNIVIEDYKLIRDSGNYYIIPWDESKRYKVSDIKLYDYKEFN